MVNVKEHALRALEQDSTPTALRGIEVPPDRLCEGEDEVRDLREIVAEALAVDRRLAETGAKRVMVSTKAVEERLQLT